jgi:hypothetical protein
MIKMSNVNEIEIKRNIVLKFNNEKWELKNLNMNVIKKFSVMLNHIVDNSTSTDIIYLNGLHLLAFKKILKFCYHHFDKLKYNPYILNNNINLDNLISYDDWDSLFVKNIIKQKSKIDLFDFLETCEYYKFDSICRLFK